MWHLHRLPVKYRTLYKFRFFLMHYILRICTMPFSTRYITGFCYQDQPQVDYVLLRTEVNLESAVLVSTVHLLETDFSLCYVISLTRKCFTNSSKLYYFTAHTIYYCTMLLNVLYSTCITNTTFIDLFTFF